MSKLQLLLMGHFECLLPSGEPVSLSMRKAEVLLAYLALAPGIRHPRERLINLLWSDRAEEQARNSLRQCLSAIRKSLGDAAELVLQVERTTVCLKADMIEVDALEFERLAAGADFESLTDAAALYRGEFLEGVGIRDAASQEWLDNARARFKRQYVEILTNLGHTLLVSRDYAQAIQNAERLVEQDPLSESGWRVLMRAYHENGDRGHALQAFKRCQQLLRNDLGVDPESETLELRARIATGERAPDETATRSSHATRAAKPTSQNPVRDAASTTDRSIAVLPFDNLSGDPEQEYFSDGITDSIIMNLALFPGLQVKSRNSSFAFKEQIKSLGEISEELQVDYIVEGAIRKASNRVRISVQLIDADSGSQIWGNRFDAEMADLFELEEELSRSIATTVTGKIESELQRIAIAKGAADQQAYDLLLAGIYHMHRFNQQDNAIAIDKFQQCLAQDPDNVRAHAFLSGCHVMNYLDRWTEDYRSSFEMAGTHIRKALALDPDHSRVLTFYGEYLNFSKRFDEAEIILGKALARNPNDPDAITTLAVCKRARGDHEQALALAEKACRLDPYHPWAEWRLASSQYLCGRYEDALATMQNFRTSPDFTGLIGIATLVKLDRLAEARKAVKAFLRKCRESMLSMPQSRNQWLSYASDNFPYPDVTLSEDLVDSLLRAGLEQGPVEAPPAVGDITQTIAVLPFDNLSGDPEQEYFSDGITESIILNLALFPGLNVKSRNSSFAFKQQLKGLAEISRELHVDYVVEGSVRKSKDRIRITAQLIDAASGNQVWGNRYDAEIDDLFELEENLSREIAATVTGRIESELQRIAIDKGAADQESYELLLSGIHHAHQFTRLDTEIAIEELNLCLQKDPQNVRAHKQLYSCHLMNYLDRWSEDYRASFELAAEHISKAIALAPQSDMAQVFYAQYLVFRGEFEQAATFLDKALATNPNNPDALTTVALNLEMQGKAEDALVAAERSCRLDPYHPWAEWEVAVSLFLAAKFERVIETIAKMRTSPGFIRIFGIASKVRLGKIEDARRELEIFLQECRDDMLAMPQSRDEWLLYTRENYPFADPQINRDLLEDLLRAGLGEQMARIEGISPVTSRDTSIAVLPFDNLSGDPEQEYFSDGITESIILNLARFPGVHVKSRNSSFAFKQQLKGLAEISQELDVDYVVEGSVRKSKDRIRITAQLIDAGSGNQVWGNRYEVGLEDLFEVEEELSRSIAATVTGRIESELQRIAIAKGAADQQAYDLLLAGQYHVYRWNHDDNAIAIEKFEQCLQQDPDNVRAHVGLYICYSMAYIGHWVEDHTDSFRKAKDYIERALRLDPDDRTARVFNAEMLCFGGKFEQARAQLDKLLKTNPNDTNALAVLAMLQEICGEPEAALATTRHTLMLDPYHPWAEWELAVSQYLLGDYEAVLEAIANMRARPGFITVFGVVADVRLGRMQSARERLREFLAECEAEMKSLPRSVDEWLQYTRENYLFSDVQLNHDLIDTLKLAGLEEFLPATNAQADSTALPSILVLPFANLSGDPEQEYFSDGITDSVIVNLSAFPGLRVKSRHASFAFKESARTIDEIATELGVDYIVEGNIRNFGNKVRITAQLSETGSGNQVWGKRFDYDLADLFALEEELCMTIAGTVNTRVDKQVRQQALRKPAKDLQSYDHYMRGCYHLELFTAENIGLAIEHFEKCLALDANNSLAHAKLGIAHMVALYENCAVDRQHSSELIDKHLGRALELDPDDAEAHAFMAERALYKRNYGRALVHARKAVELNPTLADGHSMLAWHASAMGRLDEAREFAEKSMQTDIHHPYAGWNAGEIYRLRGEYELAIDTFRSMAHISTSVHAQIAACLAGLNRSDEARAEMRIYLELAREQMISMPTSRDQWYAYWWDAMPYRHKADSDQFFELLLEAGLCDDLNETGEGMPSLAVLPLKNLSGDSDQDYFSDGITSSLILSLGMFRGLRVKSQNSSFAYRNSNKSSTDIAGELDVDFLVEGSMRKSGSRVRLTVQLVEAASDTQIWGKQYDAEFDDILELEQQLSGAVAGTISGRIGHTLQKTASHKPAKNLRSYDYLLRGLYHFGKFTARDLAIARDMLEKCLALDPDNAVAHSNLGTVHLVELMENWATDRQQSDKSAAHHLQLAIELDPDNALAHAYLSEFLLVIRRDFAQSEFHADKAIECNPTASEGYVAKADLLCMIRRVDEAVPFADKGLQLDPHSVGAGWAAGVVYRQAGLYQQAIKTFRSISHPPTSVHALISACFVQMELLEEARQEMQVYRQLAKREMSSFPENKGEWRNFWRLNIPYQHEEDFEELFDQLVGAGLLDPEDDSAGEVPSLAVLPFENMSDDPEQAFFSDGITADITSTLAKFKHLRTVARHSTEIYRERKASIAEIAAEQGVRYILEGNVRRSGNRIRVSAELIDSEGEQICWSERYDRDLDDLFAVQDEITQKITLAMKVQLDDGEKASRRSAGTSNIKVWELTLTAVDLQDTYIQQNIIDSRAMLQRAIELDSDYCYAWIFLGWTHWQEAYSGWCESFEDSMRAAQAAVDKAIDLEPENGEAWALQGTLYVMRHEPQKAIAACREALGLEPGNAELHALAGFALNFVGDYAKAGDHFHKALRLCPVCPNWYYLVGAQAEKATGNLDRCIELLRRGVEVETESPLIRFHLANALLDSGDDAGARRVAAEIRQLDKHMTGKGLVQTYSHDETERERFRRNLESLGLV